MKHIKEPPPPLPADLPPNVRELIEITLVKNPSMRYRSGGPFADAVAAVRAGRRPPRPNQPRRPAVAPPPPPFRRARKHAPRPAPPLARPPCVATCRLPAVTGTPPPRRTFSSGQRALLWAAGVLGALAIIIAIFIWLDGAAQPAIPDGDRHRKPAQQAWVGLGESN